MATHSNLLTPLETRVLELSLELVLRRLVNMALWRTCPALLPLSNKNKIQNSESNLGHPWQTQIKSLSCGVIPREPRSPLATYGRTGKNLLAEGEQGR